MKNKLSVLNLTLVAMCMISTLACGFLNRIRNNSSNISANSEAKTNKNTPTVSDAPKDAPRTYLQINGDEIKNLNKGLTPSEPCGYLQDFLKKTPTPYKEYKNSGSYECNTEFLMINNASFRYSASGNKDYISVLSFSQNVGAKNSVDQTTTMLGLMIGNIADVLKKVSGQTLPKELTNAIADKKELKYVFNDGTTSKPRAYQLQVFNITNSYYVMIYFE